MNLDFSNYEFNRKDNPDAEHDLLFEVVYTSGTYRKEWAYFGFTHYEGRLDVWEYHGESLVGNEDTTIAGSTRYEVFTEIIRNTECVAIVGESPDEGHLYCTKTETYSVDEFKGADDFVRYLRLADDFDSLEDTRTFFGDEDDDFPLLKTQLENTIAASYYQTREQYERHFAKLSGDYIRERLADDFARKKTECKEMSDWAGNKRDEVGYHV